MCKLNLTSCLIGLSVVLGICVSQRSASATILPAVGSGTLRMHLVADAGSVVKDGSNFVSDWNDSAGPNNFTASGAARPLWVNGALGGQPVIRFDGNSDILKVVVGNDITTANLGAAFTFFVAVAGGVTGNPYGLFDSAPGTANVFRFGDGNNEVELWTNNPDVPVTFNTGGTILAVRANSSRFLEVLNQPIFTGSPTTTSENGSAGTVTWTNLPAIGAYNGNQYFTGDVGEMVIYQGQLSAEDRDAVAQAMLFFFNPPPVPEPSSLALLGLGTIGLAVKARRCRAATLSNN